MNSKFFWDSKLVVDWINEGYISQNPLLKDGILQVPKLKTFFTMFFGDSKLVVNRINEGYISQNLLLKDIILQVLKLETFFS
jgi:hypothetical protein